MMLITGIHCLQYCVIHGIQNCDLQSLHCGVQYCDPSYSPISAAVPYGGIYSHHFCKDL